VGSEDRVSILINELREMARQGSDRGPMVALSFFRWGHLGNPRKVPGPHHRPAL